MNNGGIILSFIAGVAVGVGATWYYFKTRYEQIMEEDAQGLRELYSEESEAEPKEEAPNPSADIRELAAISQENNYVNYNDLKEATKLEPRPYVINPTEYDDNDEYETATLYYYADGVLVDDNDVPVEDADDIVGLESLTHFGEYEEDSVFVRNDRLRCDYEILLDTRNYADETRR